MITAAGTLVVGFVVGLLVGKKNPSIATAAEALAKQGETVTTAALATAKSKL